MEKQHDDILMKARSYRSVLTTGLRLYTAHFRSFFKSSWQMALLFALAAGALGTLAAIKIPEIGVSILQQLIVFQGFFVQTAMQYGVILLEIIALAAVVLLTQTLAEATVLAKLKEHRDTGIISRPAHWLSASPRLMGRTLKGMLFTILIVGTAVALSCAIMLALRALSPETAQAHLTVFLSAFLFLQVVILVLTLPLTHVVMKYVMEAPLSYWRALRENYGRAMRHWGHLFLVFFVSLLLTQTAALVILLPTHILNFANLTAYYGQLMGDPLGMPSYITILTFITFTFCHFILFYAILPMLIHNYYVYGSIEAKEKEREELKNSQL